jgi:ribonuclease P/MRP protein subunit POP1
MAPKRTNEGDDVGGRAKKKLKISAARTIAVQTNQSEAATAEKKTSSSQQGLPTTIDVEKFVEVSGFLLEV